MHRSPAHRHVRQRLAAFLSLLSLFALTGAVAQAATLTVGPGGTYQTIQAAIGAAANGDTVLVASGTYTENIDFLGKVIAVASDTANGATTQNTIIDGSGNPGLPTVRFVSGESRTVVNGQNIGTTLQGFTIRNGGGSSPTGTDPVGAIGGIYISGSAPILIGNVITTNACFGIHAFASRPLIQGNQITATNGAAAPCHSAGAGILIDGIAANNTALLPLIQGNSIFSNNFLPSGGATSGFGGSGITVGGAAGVAIEDNTLAGNLNVGPGGGIAVSNTNSVFIADNLIVANQAEQGAGIWIDSPLPSTGIPSAVVSNNTVVGNSNAPSPADVGGDTDAQVLLSRGVSRFVVANNIIQGTVATTAGLSCSNLQPSIPPAIDSNDIYSSTGGRTIGGSPLCVAQGTQFGNLSVDPQFVNPLSDFHLQSTSPLIDNGNTSVILDLALFVPTTAPDLDRKPRTVDATGKGYPQIDMSAYEASGTVDAVLNAALLTANIYEIAGGASAQLTAAVATSAANPATGSVTLSRINPDGTTPQPDVQPLVVTPTTPTNPGGDSATFTAGPLSPGLYALQASYPTPSVGSPATGVHTYILVDPYVSSLTLSCTPNPITFGQAVTLSLALTSTNGGVPPGTLSLSVDNGQFTDTIQPDASGNATYNLGPPGSAPLAVTPPAHTITVSYAGTAAYGPATANCTENVTAVTGASTATILSAAPNPVALGQTVTFTAHVSNTATGGTAIPTGTVQLYDGNSPLGAPATLNAGANVTILINTLTQGTHSITAVYTPSQGAAFAGSTSNPVSVTITGQAATASLTSSPNPALAGSPVTLATTVQGTAGGATPTGTVVFFDGNSPIGAPVTLTPGGTATLVYTGFLASSNGTPLTHALHAVYSGDTTYATSTSAVVNEVINPNPTATAVQVSPAATPAFQPVVVSAHTSSGTSGSPVNTPACVSGSCTAPAITFLANGAVIGTAPVDSAGNASLTFNPAAGTYSVTAVFSGSGLFAPSTSSPGASLTVTAVQPSLALVAAPSTIIVRQTAQLTATVVAPGAPPAALTGTVSFADGSAAIGSAALVNGTVTVPYAPTTAGTHVLFAHFNGTPSLLPADATFTLIVLPQDFTITPANPTISIRIERHTTTTVRIDTVGGLVDTIQLSCDNLPAYLTCAFRPGSVTVGDPTGAGGSGGAPSSTATVNLYLDTDFVLGYAQLNRPASPAAPGHLSPLRSFGPAVLALLFPAALFFGLRHRIALPRLLLVMILSAGVFSASGCSGLYPPHVAPGTYTVTLTGHAQNNNFTRTAPLTIVVTP